jgi:hypothetical protein
MTAMAGALRKNCADRVTMFGSRLPGLKKREKSLILVILMLPLEKIN